jgi:hypothetical protein
MSNEEESLEPLGDLTPGERELESALGRLTPAAARFGPSQVEMRALVARERGRARRWRAVAAVLAVGGTVALWAKLAAPPGTPQVIERGVIREVERPAAPDLRWTVDEARGDRSRRGGMDRVPAVFAYLQLRETVLSRGPESLRGPRGVPPSDDLPQLMGVDRAKPVAAPRSVLDYLLPGGHL